MTLAKPVRNCSDGKMGSLQSARFSFHNLVETQKISAKLQITKKDYRIK